jgi:hypothetical protein
MPIGKIMKLSKHRVAMLQIERQSLKAESLQEDVMATASESFIFRGL